MWQGRIVGQQARISVAFPQANGLDIAIEFVIDTGFEGALTLPTNDIAAPGLPKVQETEVTLADGSEISLDVYEAVILWHDVPVAVAVIAMNSQPLLGTALLDGNDIAAEWMHGGAFRITPRP